MRLRLSNVQPLTNSLPLFFHSNLKALQPGSEVFYLQAFVHFSKAFTQKAQRHLPHAASYLFSKKLSLI